MFVAWPLYVIHAVLTGTSMALTNALGIKDGFGFSAGLFDYVAQLQHRHQAAAAHPDRAGLRRRLLLPVPVRDPQVEPADARPRGRGRRRPAAARCSSSRQQGLSVILAARQVVTPARVLAPGWVARRRRPDRRGRRGTPPRAPDVDLGGGTSSRGSSTPTCTAAGARRSTAVTGGRGATVVADAHLAHGTTTMVASLVTDTPSGWPRRPRARPPLVRRRAARRHPPRGAVAQPAALPARTTRRCSPTRTRPRSTRLLAAGDGAVRMVTLAPELPGGLDAVGGSPTRGVVAAIGHTDATYDVARAALDAGARVGTHLFNAMRAAAPPRARPGRRAARAPRRRTSS